MVAEQNRDVVEKLRDQGQPAVAGNAAEPGVLIQAHIADAAMLVIACSDPLNVRQMVETARLLNPQIEILLRTHSESESELLRRDHCGTVFLGEEELAKSMSAHALAHFSQHGNKAP